MEPIEFTKFVASGNDFVAIETDSNRLPDDWNLACLAKEICNRRFGIGCDQLLAFSSSGDGDCRMRIFDPDGTEAEVCGNGLLTAGVWLAEKRNERDGPGAVYRVETMAGIRQVHLTGPGQARADLDVPSTRCRDLGLDLSSAVGSRGAGREALFALQAIDVAGVFGERTIYPVSMGNPHAVTRVEDVRAVPIESWGPALECHPLFRDRANIEFVEGDGPNSLKVRVWERGTGETLSCGSGACAAAAVALSEGWVESPVTLEYPGGDLKVSLDKRSHLILEGPSRKVFEGRFRLRRD